jgi:hypothetical protein
LALKTPKFYLAGSKRARKSGFLQSIDRKNPQVEQALRMARPVLAFCFVCAAVPLFSRGAGEEDRPLVYTEYVLCITAFDVSELPQSQQAIGRLLLNRFTRRLAAVKIRTRTETEREWYEQAARNDARREAGEKLAAKRDERDQLIFAGLPGWKFRKECKRVDKEIADLEAGFTKVDTIRPRAEEMPAFKLAEGNPSAPLPGEEESFLTTQKADAFLTVSLYPYYGRVGARLRIYSRFHAASYEEEVVFSPEDLNDAADEIAFRLEEAASGEGRAMLTIRAEPEKAQVLVDGKLAVKGEPVVVNPGTVSVVVSAEDYQPFEGEIDLAPGEQTASNIVLDPMEMEALALSLTDGGPAKIYIGALYAGELPSYGTFEFRVPRGMYRYLNAETEDGRAGRVIVLGGEENRSLSIQPRILPAPDEKPVEKRRRQFYGAWGRFWVSLPVTFFIYGMKIMYEAHLTVGDESMYNTAVLTNNLFTGGAIVTGIFGAESLVRLIIYINTANKEAVPLWDY